MTSYDRHASHDSPYRTGQHMPLNQSRHAPLTSVATATSAMDSRNDLSSPYVDEVSSPTSMGFRNEITSPASPYSPGMRSSSILNRTSSQDNTMDPVAPGEIQMQSFQEGLPPPPPVQHSWKRIDRWVEDNYTELWDQLGDGCTQNDVNELEHELDCSLPMEVRESLQVHDGQERGGRPTGIIFGCMLLDCEEIVQEWKNWRTVNEDYLQAPSNNGIQPPKAFGASSSSSATAQGPNPHWRQDLLEKQDSQPPKAIQKAYAHPGWVPLARDWGGNNIAVDLAPGPAGKWGQIIIFGRDFDCKYVISRSWAAFLATVADDMGSEKVFVDEDSQELKLREFKQQSVEPAYLDILRWRMDQKYGRRPMKKKAPSGVDTSRKGSPYGSPTEERGRSPNRFPGRGPSTQSPRATGVGIPSPLSQVSEETVRPFPARPAIDTSNKPENLKSAPIEKLVEAPTPTVAADATREPTLADALTAKAEETESKEQPVTGLGVGGLEEMKNVAI
ncbi:Cell wall assembly regulator [Thelotrema lepadinum]|nr:Cell wall assembly regulator [Thelotrema lepadinum]